MSAAYITPGKAATLARKKFRREVASGRAAWTAEGYEHDDRGRLVAHPEMAQGAPVAPVRVALPRARRPFGEGLGERNPVYRAPVSLSDMAWWEEEANREIERDLDRRFAEYQAQERLSSGWDC